MVYLINDSFELKRFLTVVILRRKKKHFAVILVLFLNFRSILVFYAVTLGMGHCKLHFSFSAGFLLRSCSSVYTALEEDWKAGEDQ